jgi:hypothetical protein
MQDYPCSSLIFPTVAGARLKQFTPVRKNAYHPSVAQLVAPRPAFCPPSAEVLPLPGLTLTESFGTDGKQVAPVLHVLDTPGFSNSAFPAPDTAVSPDAAGNLGLYTTAPVSQHHPIADFTGEVLSFAAALRRHGKSSAPDAGRFVAVLAALSVAVDASHFGSEARFARTVQPQLASAYLRCVFIDQALHLQLHARTDLPPNTEITLPEPLNLRYWLRQPAARLERLFPDYGFSCAADFVRSALGAPSLREQAAELVAEYRAASGDEDAVAVDEDDLEALAPFSAFARPNVPDAERLRIAVAADLSSTDLTPFLTPRTVLGVFFLSPYAWFPAGADDPLTGPELAACKQPLHLRALDGPASLSLPSLTAILLAAQKGHHPIWRKQRPRPFPAGAQSPSSFAAASLGSGPETAADPSETVQSVASASGPAKTEASSPRQRSPRPAVPHLSPEPPKLNMTAVSLTVPRVRLRPTPLGGRVASLSFASSGRDAPGTPSGHVVRRFRPLDWLGGTVNIGNL